MPSPEEVEQLIEQAATHYRIELYDWQRVFLRHAIADGGLVLLTPRGRGGLQTLERMWAQIQARMGEGPPYDPSEPPT